MMHSKTFRYAVFLLVLSCVASCAKPETVVDTFRGSSYQLALDRQIANPEAGIDPQPIEGMEGKIEQLVLERYQEGFKRPVPKVETYSVKSDVMLRK